MGFQYRASGLDNVFLSDGPPSGADGADGDGRPISDSVGLHRAIGSWLVSTPKTLTGAEVRFLRLEMNMTQRRLAELLGAKVQTVRFWEKHRAKDVNGAADRLLRILYAEAVAGRDTIRCEMDRLQKRSEADTPQVFLHRTDAGWQIDGAPSHDPRG